VSVEGRIEIEGSDGLIMEDSDISEMLDEWNVDFKVYTRMHWNLLPVGMFECSTIDNTDNLKVK
jgi:hypothetical protein